MDLFRKAGVLKNTVREGWKRAGIDEPESVADHSFRAAFIALILGEEWDLDGFKLVKLLLVHDIAESVIGDLTPEDNISEPEKFDKEEKAIRGISKSFEGGFDLLALWKEFERGECREAMVARDIDRTEMILQALEYEEKYPEKDLSEFLSLEDVNLETSEIRELLESILNEQ